MVHFISIILQSWVTIRSRVSGQKVYGDATLPRPRTFKVFKNIHGFIILCYFFKNYEVHFLVAKKVDININLQR